MIQIDRTIRKLANDIAYNHGGWEVDWNTVSFYTDSACALSESGVYVDVTKFGAPTTDIYTSNITTNSDESHLLFTAIDIAIKKKISEERRVLMSDIESKLALSTKEITK